MDHCLLNVLRESVYGDIRSFWQNNCSPEEKDRICRYCLEIGLAPYLYRYLHDLLPADQQMLFKRQYTANSLNTLKYQQGLNELQRLFEQNAVRFCILKGGDFAFSYYPDPAMRYFCDLDIWIHPDDCTKMLELLNKNGWKAPYLNTEQIAEHHHYSPHQKNGVVLEPHWSLSSFHSCDPTDLWNDFLSVEPSRQYRYKMAPEVKLLALCRHFATDEYRHMPLCKFLLDAAWILKNETVDWEKLRSLSARFNFESCNDLLGSQNDFFPPEMIRAIDPDPEIAQTFRNLFEIQDRLPEMDTIETQMQTTGKFSKLWFLARFHAISPIAIRRKYQLPEKGSNLRVLGMTLYDIGTKTAGLLKSIKRQDPAVKEYNRLLQKISSRSE